MDWNDSAAPFATQDPHACTGYSPLHLSFACLLNGFEPITPDKPFTYLELGVGNGHLAGFAGCFPHGRFYAASVREPLAVAGPDNVIPITHSLAEIAAGNADLPQFDFIALPGTYTALAVAQRHRIVQLLARHLAPGGIVHAGFDTMPGWSARQSVQRLLQDYTALHTAGGESEHSAFAAGCTFVQSLADAGAKHFEGAGARAQWERFKNMPEQERARICLDRDLSPLYFADVAADFSAAKLDFAGSADFTRIFPQSFLSPEQCDFLDTSESAALRETLTDFLCNTAYRNDLFVRGARPLHPARAMLLFARYGLTSKGGKPDARPQSVTPGTAQAAVLAALAERPHTLAELLTLPVFHDAGAKALLETAAGVIAAGYATPVLGGTGFEKEAE